jgi:hypothetical protein
MAGDFPAIFLYIYPYSIYKRYNDLHDLLHVSLKNNLNFSLRHAISLI